MNWFQFHTATSALSDQASTDAISLYPNPMINELTIKGAAGSSLRLFDMTGVQLMSRSIDTDEYSIDTQNLSSGIYLVEVIGKTGYVNSYKVVK